MIHAHLATYPPRLRTLPAVIRALAPQVDRMRVVLNEFTEVPEALPQLAAVDYILPPEDTKDTGKFLPEPEGADWIALVDDDLIYPPDYVSRSLDRIAALNAPRTVFGYHASLYRLSTLPPVLRRGLSGLGAVPALRRSRRFQKRRVVSFWRGCDAAVRVDQLGTGTVFLRGADYPGFAAMRDAQRFVDVRLARLAREAGCDMVCLPRAAGWIGAEEYDETIFDFTRSLPPHVADEIAAYVGRREGIGAAVPRSRG